MQSLIFNRGLFAGSRPRFLFRRLLSVSCNDDHIAIRGDGGEDCKFHFQWLRDHCRYVRKEPAEFARMCK